MLSDGSYNSEQLDKTIPTLHVYWNVWKEWNKHVLESQESNNINNDDTAEDTEQGNTLAKDITKTLIQDCCKYS
jgi:hypothetical protein